MKAVQLKPGREKPLRRFHPWVFSGAIRGVAGQPSPGETVDVVSHDDQWLARGAYSPQSQIRVRIWTWDEGQQVDERFLQRRIRSAVERRRGFRDNPGTNGYREIYAESDGIPGLIVDRYGSTRVVQLLSAGAEAWRDTISQLLMELDGCQALVERSDVDARRQEGLESRSGVLAGELPSMPVEITENGLRYAVDLLGGQKTGFYFDQRENRRLVGESANLGRVLDCFCYTGGFALAALRGGAEQVLAIDASAPALDLARKNVELNKLPRQRLELRKGDIFQELRRLRDEGRTFDTVILDPPLFASTPAQQHKAARGYKDINMLAARLLTDDGRLFTFSCSGGVSPELFQKIVAGAAADAGVPLQVVGWPGQPADHPVALNFPESRYLKGLVCRKAGSQFVRERMRS
jgi:23S rRNA (cytosine1962-C5)-methyltransferase